MVSEVVRNLGFEVRAGEILGIAGVQGNGQTELVESLTGLRERKSGQVLLGGKEIPELCPAPQRGSRAGAHSRGPSQARAGAGVFHRR